MNEQANKPEDHSVFSIPAGAMSRGVQGGPTGVCVMNYKVTGAIADKLRSLQEFYRDPSVYFVVAPGEEATQDPVAAKRVWFSLETPADRIWVVIPSEKVETIEATRCSSLTLHNHIFVPPGYTISGFDGGATGLRIRKFYIAGADVAETLISLRGTFHNSRFLLNPAMLDELGTTTVPLPVVNDRVPTREVWVLTPHDETDADVNPIVGRIAKTPSGLSFSDALVAMKEGKRVARVGWDGKSMHLWLLPAATVKAEWCREPHLKAIAEANGGEVECLGSIRMLTADKKVLTGWMASQSDILAEDWIILPEDNA